METTIGRYRTNIDTEEKINVMHLFACYCATRVLSELAGHIPDYQAQEFNDAICSKMKWVLNKNSDNTATVRYYKRRCLQISESHEFYPEKAIAYAAAWACNRDEKYLEMAAFNARAAFRETHDKSEETKKDAENKELKHQEKVFCDLFNLEYTE